MFQAVGKKVSILQESATGSVVFSEPYSTVSQPKQMNLVIDLSFLKDLALQTNITFGISFKHNCQFPVGIDGKVESGFIKSNRNTFTFNNTG